MLFKLVGVQLSFLQDDSKARAQALLRILLVDHLNGVNGQHLLLHHQRRAHDLRTEEAKDGFRRRPDQPNHDGRHRPLVEAAAGAGAGVQED